tara:strand:- start:115 stop:1398 length:1284 start_codon:yes stop_codon:yes gene_type:complete
MKRISVKLIILLAVLSLAACSSQPIGYAVVLWPEPDSGLAEGELLPVVTESDIQETVGLEVEDATVSVDAWRVMRFEDQAAAQSFVDGFSQWATVYGRSLRTALPVRERADRTTTRVYRLRDGELVKILDREDEESNEAGLVDYWYRVLTREGITGWVFGYHLELTGASGRSTQSSAQQDSTTRLLEDIAGVDWRPDYFDRMIQSGRVVLSRFGPRFGLFGDTEAQEFRLVLPDVQRTFSYTAVSSPSENTIRLEGTDLQLTISGDRSLQAQYNINGRERATTFVRIEDDLQEVIEAEQERRRQQLDQILSRGNGLVSTAFGTMSLGERGTVNWTGYDRLVPTVLPSSFDGTASLEFSLFLADDLRGRYDGALQMQLGSGRSTAFLYTLVEDGLRLVYVPPQLVNDDNVVEEEPISPVVMFYRFTNS